MSVETVNVGLLRKMLANVDGGIDVFATTTALNQERMIVFGVSEVEMPNGERMCILHCERIEPRTP